MAMKEIDYEGFNLNVKNKGRVKHPGFEKELLNLFSRARVTDYLKIWFWRKQTDCESAMMSMITISIFPKTGSRVSRSRTTSKAAR